MADVVLELTIPEARDVLRAVRHRLHGDEFFGDEEYGGHDCEYPDAERSFLMDLEHRLMQETR